MALVVGGKTYKRNDRRASSYKRIQSNRGISQRDLGKRSGGGTKEEAAERIRSSSTPNTQAVSIQEANKQAEMSKQPVPVASAAEGGVIFSDDFRGTPVASGATGGTIYIKNQPQPQGYERNSVGSTSGGRDPRNNRPGNSNQVGGQESFTGTVTAASAPSFRKEPIKYLERKADILEQDSSRTKSPLKKVGYSLAAGGTFVVTTGARAVEGVIRIADPSERGTIKQTARLFGAGAKEIKQTGALYSVGDYIRQNPAKAGSEVAVAVATARLPLPRRFTPRVGVAGDVLETPRSVPASFEVRQGSSSKGKASLNVEESAATALRTGSPLETQEFINRLSKDVYRRVDVTDPARFDNILPSTKEPTVQVRTVRNVGGRIDRVTKRKTAGFSTEATQVAPARLFRESEVAPKPTLRVVDSTERSRAIAFRKRVASPAAPEALGDFIRQQERPRIIDLNRALNKRYEVFIDSSGKEGIRLTQAARDKLNLERQERLNKSNLESLYGGKKPPVPRRPKKAAIEPLGKRIGRLFPNKKGQFQLFPPETVTVPKESPVDVLRRNYGRVRSRVQPRRSVPDFDPPARSRQSFAPEFIEETSISPTVRGAGFSAFKATGSSVVSLPRLDRSTSPEFRSVLDTSPSLDTRQESKAGQFTFRSIGTSRTGQATALAFAPPIIGNVLGGGKPGKNGITRFYRGTESGGGGSGGRDFSRVIGERKKYYTSFTGIEGGFKASRSQRKAGGSGGGGLSGLEVRGI